MDVKSTEKIINFQKKILATKNIPKKFKPQQYPSILHPQKDILFNNFITNFEKLFLEHLAEIIKLNEITLEVQKARLLSTTTPIPTEPSTSTKQQSMISNTESSSTIQTLTLNNEQQVIAPKPLPEPKIPRKRQNTSQHPKGIKKSKNHFLETRLANLNKVT
jgi:hypothetical protein